MLKEATTENAIIVLEGAIKRYGKPASIMTDHSSQFYANEAEARKRGESAHEKMVELDIKQILAGVRHPQPTASSSGCTARCSARSTRSRMWQVRRAPDVR